MLQVKNLCKQYTNKKQVVTTALDDVNLTFPETGMVFILGKSGSGKSTLLNVCGGLDKCTSGEIVIKGKSSADFSTSDFDSYRNTYVGFVFQEYNILEDFTVEENIALALELQNRKPSREVIDKILAEVEMTEFASRKPNTLSGGQKQRVAIARALVKEPQIIMADEPTGALDSQTGQQVFDTLKRLSNDKLVLVVSHDRDFAEQYADRIIELKDGKVISDVVRGVQQDNDSNVTFYNGDTVCVKDGANLTDKDLDDIKKFLTKSNGSAVITTAQDKIAEVRKSLPKARSGAFEEITEQPQSKQYGEQKLIHSKFPLRHAVKMGAGSLKTKPVRLVFTILLSVIAFVLFGLASTLMLFDDRQITINTLTKTDDEYVELGKVYYQTQTRYVGDRLVDEYPQKFSTRFTYDEYKALKQKYPNALAAVNDSTQIENLELGKYAQAYYSNSFSNYVIADKSLTVLEGRLPTSADEIAITDFMFDAFRSAGARFWYYVDGEKKNVTLTEDDYSQILYSEARPIVLRLKGVDFKLVGVVKGGVLPDKFADFKKAADENKTYNFTNDHDGNLFKGIISNGMYNNAVVTEEFIAQNVRIGLNDKPSHFYFNELESRLRLDIDDIGDMTAGPLMLIGMGTKYEKDSGRLVLDMFDMQGNRITEIESNGVVLSVYDLHHIYSQVLKDFRDKYDEQYNEDEQARLDKVFDEALAQYEKEHPAPEGTGTGEEYAKWREAREEYAKQARLDANKMKPYLLLVQQIETEAEQAYIANNPKPDGSAELDNWQKGLEKVKEDALKEKDIVAWLEVYKKLSLEHALSMFDKTRALFAELGVNVDFKLSELNLIKTRNVTIVGVVNEEIGASAYFSDDLYDALGNDGGRNYKYYSSYVIPDNAYVTNILIPKDSKKIMVQLVDLTNLRNNDSSVKINNTIVRELESISATARVLSTAFLIAGLSLALFAFLLMFNFISVSISSQKREIGILRAIGARTVDVFKIFLSEALIIAIICFALSAGSAAGLCALLNWMLTDSLLLRVEIFIFGPLSVLCVFAIAVVTAVVATIIPVAIYGRKPPVESIRAL